MSEKKLKDILKMSLKLTPQEEAPVSSVEMDSERREFLKGAIKQAIEEDDAVKIVSMTQLFLSFNPAQTYDAENLQYLKNIYQQLNYLNEGFDIAKIFSSEGGMKHNLELLKKTPHLDLKIEAADLIGNSTQNNPTVQITLLENHGLIILLYTIKKSSSDDLLVKCLYALSTLVGGNDYAEKELCKLVDGDFFMKMITHDNERIRIKSAFLLMKLASSEALSVDTIKKLVSTRLIVHLVHVLQSHQERWHSHLLRLLVSCFSKCQPDTLLSGSQIDEAIKTFETKKKTLFCEDKELYEGDIECCQTLVSLLQKASSIL